jgi:dTDP-4-amino-4,6-dideoxygalactose transaminase
MEQLESIARKHNLAIIEDACQAHAAKVKGKPVGSFGTGCFSFYPTKNMTTGEGGMVTTSDPLIAERVRLMRNHGQKERYSHTMIGYNLRMTEMQAAIGLVQLRKLEQFTRQRRANAQFLNTHLGGLVQTPITRPGHYHVYHQYTIRLPEGRDEWVIQLHTRGIATGVHYPLPIYRQPFYQNSLSCFRISYSDKKLYGKSTTQIVGLPATEAAAQQVLSLPIHPALEKEDLLTIVREIGALCN